MVKESRDSEPLDPKLVSSREGDIAGSVDMLSALPVCMRDFYSSGSVLDEPDFDSLKATKKCLMIKDGKYAQLVITLLEKKVIELVDTKPLEINGLLAVEKDKTKQRLILDARRANHYFVEPDDPQIPHPGLFTQLHMKKSEEIYVGKIDLDNYYYRLELPKQFRPYFGLLLINPNGKTVWPRFRVVPMGWSHLVTAAMAITEEIMLNDAHLDPSRKSSANAPANVGRCRYGAHIDNIFKLGTDKREINKVYNGIYSPCESRKLPPKSSKCLRPCRGSLEVLEVEFTSSGVIAPSKEKMNKLLEATHASLNERFWHVRTLQAIIGSWKWFMLLARPAFSIFQRIYDLTSSEKKVLFATAEAKQKLRMIGALLPLCFANIARPSAEVLLCSDASMIGGASLYGTNMSWHESQDMLIGNYHSMLSSKSSLPKIKWKTIHTQQWKYPTHINVLKGRAFLTGIRWIARQRWRLGTRVAALIDSRVIYYITSRGRSGAQRLWQLSRKLGALLLGTQTRVVPIWVRSEDNPADAPSRRI